MSRVILFIVLIAFVSSCELERKDDSMAAIISKKKLQDMVNDLRANGCDCGGTYMPPVAPLKWDYQLERAAIAHSIDMNVQGYFEHEGLDGSTYISRISGTDYKGHPGGENIAWGVTTEEAVFNIWRNSPGHCTNMMNGSHTDIAVGRSGSYWTMVFGRRK